MSAMRVVFRADASTRMGTGHVMRCLTLAEVLGQHGASCSFVCSAHPGHLAGLVRERGHECIVLPQPGDTDAAWKEDARQTLAALAPATADWLVVDHYALDARWEQAVRPGCRRLMAIDDLADRPHACELLLDQNLGRRASDYRALLPGSSRVLAGPEYAMLRPEFAALRAQSLSRRRNSPVRQLLISLGGADADDRTGQVLQALADAGLPPGCDITVVMGAQAPWLARVRARAAALPWPTQVLVNAQDMAQRMAQSDLAIGGAGTTAWERCCVGLPTLLVVVAENQRPGAEALSAAGAAILLPQDGHFAAALGQQVARLAADADALGQMQQASAAVTDGLGAGRVARELLA